MCRCVCCTLFSRLDSSFLLCDILKPVGFHIEESTGFIAFFYSAFFSFYSLFELLFIFMLGRYSASYMSFTFVFLKDLFLRLEKLRRFSADVLSDHLCTVDLLMPNSLAAQAYRGSVCRNIFLPAYTSFL